MNSQSPKPEFATNRPDERVADALNSHLAHLRAVWAEPPDVAIATAYFNVGGFLLLAAELEKVGKVRLLLGADPQVPDVRIRSLKESTNPSRAERARMKTALTAQVSDLSEARDLLGFSEEADAGARRLVEWLSNGRVEVRRLENSFLHGKAFIVTSYDEGVIAGSSNFTYAGLAKNLELNLGHYQPHVVTQVSDWFGALWDQAKDFDLTTLYASRFEPHPPYLIYLRMLFERYGAELVDEAMQDPIARMQLTTFQRDGLWRARRTIAERNGVLIADEVGLGKTYLAGSLIREAVEERRQRVLVVAPAALRDGPWRRFLQTYQLGVERVSFDDLVADKRLTPGANDVRLQFAPDEYAMIVVDEAHNLRNPTTKRAFALRRLLAGYPPKSLVLLTATPVNNSLWDLYHLLGFFLHNDAAFADVGIRSLRDHFASAMAMNPEDLSPEHLFDVLDAVAVRRTRAFVKKYYPSDTVNIGGRDLPITFPSPRVLKVDYDLDDVLPGFFDRLAYALDGGTTSGGSSGPSVLTLARYSPSRYLLEGAASAYEVQLAGLIRSGLLKRFESSSYAFAKTCRKMAQSHDGFIALLSAGKIATSQAIQEWLATDYDSDEASAFFDLYNDQLDDASKYDCDVLASDVMSDRDVLLRWADEAEAVEAERDPKLNILVEELCSISRKARETGLSEPEVRDKRKVLVFTYYADTAHWVTDYLYRAVEEDPRLTDYCGRIAFLSGTEGSREDVLWGFAPRTADAPDGADSDLYDILVCTDVLAEGVNLQQAQNIINYDLPWNPMRLVQRHGRVDRIGSQHSEVYLRCFFPDRQLDQLLGLEERLQRKIQQAAKSVGTGEILPGSEAEDVVFTETRDEIERIRGGDASIFERGGSRKGAVSGEEYRQELRQAMENEEIAKRLRRLPWGSGSGMAVCGRERGYVFCARIGDHDRALYRYVSLEGEAPLVVDDTLSCLDHANPPAGFDTARVMTDDIYKQAFAAWRTAVDSIVQDWNISTDPANLMPAIPAAMRAAAELVRAHKPSEMPVADADRLIETLQAPYSNRVVENIRRVVRSDNAADDKVRALASAVLDFGLEPTPPPPPLPEISVDDVYLICWLAVVPAAEAY